MNTKRLFLAVLSVALSLLAVSAGTLLQAQGNTYRSKKEKLSDIRSIRKRDAQAAIPALAAYLKDPENSVRDEAVKSIVSVGTQRSLDPLIQATKDSDSAIQNRAIDGLVNFYVPGYVTSGGVTRTFTRVTKHVKDFFADRNEDIIPANMTVRTEVIDAIGELIGGGASMDTRADAARAAGILRANPALPELEKATKSRNSQVILESLFAIQKINDPSAGPPIAFLANDFDADVQAAAIETLGVLHTTEAAPQIRQVVQRPKNDRVKRVALESLAMLALPDDRALFLQYKDDKNADLRSSALDGLGRLRDPQDIPALESAYSGDKEGKVKLAAAFALATEGKTEMSEFSPLRYLVNGLNLSKQNDAATAYLKELSRKPEVRHALVTLLPNGTKAEKLGLIQALAPNADAETAKALQDLNKDPDTDVSIAAARAQTAKTR